MYSGERVSLGGRIAAVAASKPAVRRLPLFLAQLRPLLKVAIPTVAELDDLIY
jgi:hypothetical protein